MCFNFFLIKLPPRIPTTGGSYWAKKQIDWVYSVAGLYDKQYSSGHKFSITITGFAVTFTCGFDKQIWQCLTPKLEVFKLSGNTVKFLENYSPKPFDIWYFSVQNRSNRQVFQIMSSIFFNLTPRSSNLVRFEALSFIKRFTMASSKLSKFSKMFWANL